MSHHLFTVVDSDFTLFYETVFDKDVFNTEEVSTTVVFKNTNKYVSAIYIHSLTYSCNFMFIHLLFLLMLYQLMAYV